MFTPGVPTDGAVIELDAAVDIESTDTIGFGFNSGTITLDTSDLDGALRCRHHP